MRNCAYYIEKAIINSGLKNRAELCRILNIKQPSLFTLEKGKTLPAEATLMKLADLAGLPREEAIVDLGLWRSKNNPELNKIWLRISKMIGCVVTCLCAPFNAFAASLGAPEPRALTQYATSLLICTIVGYTSTYAVKFIYEKYILCDKLVWQRWHSLCALWIDYQVGG